MDDWQSLLRNSVYTVGHLKKSNLELTDSEIKDISTVAEIYPFLVNKYYLSLIQTKGDPIWKQSIPDILELDTNSSSDPDPLGEEKFTPISGIVHKYKDRVLFLVSNTCAMYCRFCTRKRKVGCSHGSITKTMVDNGIQYIKNHPEIRDVILSGGDPLLLSDSNLNHILSNLRAIPHVEIIRIGSRVPCVLPQRITDNLIEVLKKYHPLYINTHFEHPREVTQEAQKALARLADAGIPLGNQSVLLKGVNDSPEVFLELNRKLLACRVKPYYLYQADPVEGTKHFECPLDKGFEIVKHLIDSTSGMAVPQFVVDTETEGKKRVFRQI